ncbi:hypothetical protein [Lacticaseibacillus daqingensis]|uniref:hypothetical protein n=1 Tax=Lacticaseibacillus daqingensis TaxID=2486014 RepID=UPI000F78D124|nr:hypothetical protein [Lacticaseibacillus daqingensis]
MIKDDQAAELRPNTQEVLFLTLAFNRFYDLYDEIVKSDKFWEQAPFIRFSKIRDVFNIYGEVLHYEPIKWVIEDMRVSRPPKEAEIAEGLFRSLRNLFSHFPVFTSWDDVWFNHDLLNWDKSNQSIYKFFHGHLNDSEVKYRFWDSNREKMTYLSIRFPNQLHDKIMLADVLTEKEGVEFSLILMKKVMDYCVTSE